MATATREVKYSYKNKEFKIGITIFIVFLGYILMFSRSIQWTPNDETNFSVIVIAAIIWASNIYDWTIWKLAGGWKE